MKNKNNRKRTAELTPLQQTIVDSIEAKKPLMGEGEGLKSFEYNNVRLSKKPLD